MLLAAVIKQQNSNGFSVAAANDVCCAVCVWIYMMTLNLSSRHLGVCTPLRILSALFAPPRIASRGARFLASVTNIKLVVL